VSATSVQTYQYQSTSTHRERADGRAWETRGWFAGIVERSLGIEGQSEPYKTRADRTVESMRLDTNGKPLRDWDD